MGDPQNNATMNSNTIALINARDDQFKQFIWSSAKLATLSIGAGVASYYAFKNYDRAVFYLDKLIDHSYENGESYNFLCIGCAIKRTINMTACGIIGVGLSYYAYNSLHEAKNKYLSAHDWNTKYMNAANIDPVVQDSG